MVRPRTIAPETTPATATSAATHGPSSTTAATWTAAARWNRSVSTGSRDRSRPASSKTSTTMAAARKSARSVGGASNAFQAPTPTTVSTSMAVPRSARGGRMSAVSEARRIGLVGREVVQAGDELLELRQGKTADGCIEVLERLLDEGRGDLPIETAVAHDEDFGRLPSRGEDGILLPLIARVEHDELDRNAAAGELFRGTLADAGQLAPR